MFQSVYDYPYLSLHGYKVSKKDLDDILESLIKMTSEERANLPSLSEKRAEIIGS